MHSGYAVRLYVIGRRSRRMMGVPSILSCCVCLFVCLLCCAICNFGPDGEVDFPLAPPVLATSSARPSGQLLSVCNRPSPGRDLLCPATGRRPPPTRDTRPAASPATGKKERGPTGRETVTTLMWQRIASGVFVVRNFCNRLLLRWLHRTMGFSSYISCTVT